MEKKQFTDDKKAKWNKKGEGNYTPLFLTLFIAFAVALVLNLVLTSFDVNTNVPNPDSSLSNSSIYLTTINVLGNHNILDEGESQNFIVTQLNIWTYVPSELAIPFFIFLFIALVWSSVKLFLP